MARAKFWPSLLKVRSQKAAWWMAYAASTKAANYFWRKYLAAEKESI